MTHWRVPQMKINHNKKRNTAFIFEVLVQELTKSSIKEDHNRKNLIVGILKEFYSKNKILKQELEIYKSFEDISSKDNVLVDKILQEAKKQFVSLNRQQVFKEQSKIINIINKTLGQESWKNYIASYKKLATINQALTQDKNPKRQVLAEQKLVQMLLATDTENIKLPKINNLAMSAFIQKFNEKYTSVLSEQQKIFLSKYINSNDDNNLELKTYLYQEVENINNFLNENKNRFGQEISEKIKKVLAKVDGYKTQKFSDEIVFEVFRIQSLVSELQNHGN